MQRVLSALRSPPGGGNPSELAKAAQSVGAFVQACFVYPAANGPGTMHAAVCGAATSTNASRSVAASNVAIALAAVTAETSGDVEVVLTSTVDSPTAVTFLMTIPAAVGAGSSGGGWVDAVPFPRPYTGQTGVVVAGATSTTDITLNSLAALPAIGQTVAYINETTLQLYTARILTIPMTSGAGPYLAEVTLDAPLVGIGAGSYVFPAAARTQAYLSAALAAFAALGPGEKTNIAGLLPRAYRWPARAAAWDYTLGPKFLRALENAGDEVLDVAWLNQNFGQTTPALPAAISGAPSIFTPSAIAFYPQ